MYSGDAQDGWEEGHGSAQPDPSQAFRGTWHDATFHPEYLMPKTVTVEFVGTAVYAYFITANAIQPVPLVTTLTNLSFLLDNELQAGNFEHQPDLSRTDFDYNVLAFGKTGLVNTAHTLVMQTTPFNASLVLFDYVMYT